MTPQELRESIFSRAFEGKLVEQHTEEGTAEDTLKNIKYKTVRLLEDCTDIPETWRWTYLVDVAEILYGFPFNSEMFNDAQIGMPIIRIRDINNGYSKTYSNEPCEERYRIVKGDMLVGMDGNFQVAFWASDDAWLNQRVCKITSNSRVLIQKYLYYYLPIILKEINGTVSYSTVKHLSAKILNQMLIPLPPLAEQKRIVAKIEELLPLIDRYEQAWSALEAFNARFPVDMQKSILQMAIQGKLVPQLPEEGTGEELFRQIQAEKQALIKTGKIKKEKPLPEIAEDEIPFDIPKNWKLTKLGNCIILFSGSDFKPEEYNDKGKGTPYITGASSLTDSGVLLNRWTEVPRIFAKRGDVLLVCKGSGYGKTVICDIEEAHIARQIMAIKKSDSLDMEYIRYFLQANFDLIKTKGQGVIPGIDRGSVLNLPIALPPLAEQKRIVAKLEEILPLCEQLK